MASQFEIRWEYASANVFREMPVVKIVLILLPKKQETNIDV